MRRWSRSLGPTSRLPASLKQQIHRVAHRESDRLGDPKAQTLLTRVDVAIGVPKR
jgi:hypothetical protein